MELEGLLPRCQESATVPYPEPSKSSSHLTPQISDVHFSIIVCVGFVVDKVAWKQGFSIQWNAGYPTSLLTKVVRIIGLHSYPRRSTIITFIIHCIVLIIKLKKTFKTSKAKLSCSCTELI
jgi:hypothetical protein